MDAITPEGRAKALAMETWMNRGGPLSRGRNKDKFARGPMRGKTYGEAANEFERMWARVSPSVKDKYASQARDILSPSEKRDQLPAPARPETAAEMQKRQR